MKKFSKFEIAAIKRTAQSVNILVTKKEVLKRKISELQDELKIVEDTQAPYEEAVKAITGGYTTEDIITKETVMRTDGKPSYVKFVLKYPETVIPVDSDMSAMDANADIEENENNAEAESLKTPVSQEDNQPLQEKKDEYDTMEA